MNCGIRNVPLQLEAFQKGYNWCQQIEDTSTASGLIIWTIPECVMWVNMALELKVLLPAHLKTPHALLPVNMDANDSHSWTTRE